MDMLAVGLYNIHVEAETGSQNVAFDLYLPLQLFSILKKTLQRTSILGVVLRKRSDLHCAQSKQGERQAGISLMRACCK